MGGNHQTIQNLEIVHIDPEEEMIYIRGGLPGPAGSLVEINGDKYADVAVAEN
jgi:ribosomal protein L3